MDERRRLQQRCIALRAIYPEIGPCIGTTQNLKRRVSAIEKKINSENAADDSSNPSIEQLPKELFLNEILPYANLKSVLSLCATNKKFETICSDFTFWMNRFAQYDLIQKQDAAKLWAWSGVLPDVLMTILDAFEDEIESETFRWVNLYLREQGHDVLQSWNIEQHRVSNSDFKALKDFLYYLLRAKTLRSQLETIPFFRTFLRTALHANHEYFSDLLINSLTIQQIEFLLSDGLYRELTRKEEKTTHLPSIYYSYRLPLCQAIVRSHRIDLLDPILQHLWPQTKSSTQSDATIETIYINVNLKEAKRIEEALIAANNDWLFLLFARRVLGNRETILDYIESEEFNMNKFERENMNSLSQIYRFLSPEEVLHIFSRRIAHRSDLIDALNTVQGYAYLADYNVWSNRLSSIIEALEDEDDDEQEDKHKA